MIRLSPLLVPCRWCAAGPGVRCGIVAKPKDSEFHECREVDADRASSLLDEELSGRGVGR